MKKKINMINVMAILITIFQSLNDFAKDEIMWLTAQWPPIMELDESNKNIIGGTWGEQLNLLQNNMTD